MTSFINKYYMKVIFERHCPSLCVEFTNKNKEFKRMHNLYSQSLELEDYLGKNRFSYDQLKKMYQESKNKIVHTREHQIKIEERKKREAILPCLMIEKGFM